MPSISFAMFVQTLSLAPEFKWQERPAPERVSLSSPVTGLFCTRLMFFDVRWAPLSNSGGDKGLI